MTEKKKILIDCDAGTDDAEAILMALSCPDVDVVAITTVCGKTGAVQVARNVLRLLHVADRMDVRIISTNQCAVFCVCVCVCVCDWCFTSLSTIFQSHHDDDYLLHETR